MPRFKIRGPIGFEGEPTGDGRFIEQGALRFAETIPLLFVRESSGGHDGAVVVGHFTNVTRDGNAIMAEGEFIDPDAAPEQLAEDVRTAILLVNEGHAPGVSMDLSEVSAELRVASELLSDEAFVPFDEREADEDGRITLIEFSPDDELMVFTDALVRGATLVAIPAFANARLEVLSEDDEMDELSAQVNVELSEVLAASAAPSVTLTASAPPSGADHRMFEPVAMDGPQPLTVAEDGHVLGHIALWGTCHTGMPGVCTTPPNDPTGEYRAFHQSRITTDAGVERVGVLTVGGGHADPRLGARAAIEHYDDVATVWAYVRAYEDEFGIAVTGVVADDVDERTLATALAHPVSGDWRNLGSGLELVACCSVNTPGFPVLAASAGQQTSLVAASNTVQRPPVPAKTPTAEEIAREVVKQLAALESAKVEVEVGSELEDMAKEIGAWQADSMYRHINQ